MTVRTGTGETVFVSNTEVVSEIEQLLSREFVCYGYRKVTKHLQHAGFSINKKKVFRLMSEHSLLNNTYNTRSPIRRVVDANIVVHSPNEVWEMDIKYVWIEANARNAFFLAIIDCFTREVVAHYLGTTATAVMSGIHCLAHSTGVE